MKLPSKTMNTNRKPWSYVKSHEATGKTMKPTKTIKNYVTTLKTMKLPWKTKNTNQKQWKPMKLPYKPWKLPKKHDYHVPTTLKTHENHEKSCNYLINHENQPKTKKLHWKPRCTMHYMLCTMHLLIFFQSHVWTNTQTDSALSLHLRTHRQTPRCHYI